MVHVHNQAFNDDKVPTNIWVHTIINIVETGKLLNELYSNIM
jgi:hypothetical protein